ncbi:hypothetical protein EG830_01870 [bacterium]|nr:hypothetical protein [bacterium]
MELFSKTVLTSLFVALALNAHIAIYGNDTLRYEILMNKTMLKELNIHDAFTGTMDITANRLLLISSANQFYLAGWGGLVPFGKPVQGNIDAFAFTHDSALMVIRKNELCWFDSESRLSLLFRLPEEGMKISGGDRVMYIYNASGIVDKYALYVIAQGGMYSKLLEMPSPISGVMEMGNSLLFSSGSILFDFDLKTRNLKSVTVLPADKQINSFAADKKTGRIYLSAGQAIYALKDSGAVLISDDLSGTLRFFEDGLLVFNPEDQTIIRIIGLEHEIASGTNMKPDPEIRQTVNVLKNSTVIDLVKNNLSDALIISLIRRAKVDFSLTTDDVIELSGKGVSPAVIMEMRQAMIRQASEIQNR